MKGTLARLLAMSPAPRSAVLVVLVTVPVWLLVTAWDTTIMTANALAEPGAHAAPIMLRIVQHLILLPPVLVCYFLATNPRLRSRVTALEVVRQLSLAVIFSFLVRPALILSSALLYAHEGLQKTVAAVLAQGFSPIPYLVSTVVAYLLVYFFGLALIYLVSLMLDLHGRKLVEERLHSLWASARLSSLRSQLDPHFFFNCLNTISALIRPDPEKADRMIADVSELLRSSLREYRDEFCSIAQEVAYVRRYMEIERVRFEDRLRVAIEVSEDVLDVRIPTLILQPLIENAIKHGVATQTGADTVGVRIAREDANLVCRVTNKRFDSPGGAPAGNGIGLQHVRERLAVAYGARATLEAGPQGTDSWHSVIRLPLEPVASIVKSPAPELSGALRYSR